MPSTRPFQHSPVRIGQTAQRLFRAFLSIRRTAGSGFLSLAIFVLIAATAKGGPQTPVPFLPEQGLPAEQRHREFDNAIAAVVEDRIITYQDVYAEAAPLVERVQLTSQNERQFIERMRALESEIIQSMIDRILIVKAFEKQGYQIPESFIDNEITEIVVRDFDGDRSRLLAYLRQNGMSMRDFREETREQIIVGHMRSRMRRSEAVVSPVRIEEFYRENQEQFQREESIHLRLIQLAGDAQGSLEEYTETVLQALEDGAEFAEVAREHSRDRRRQQGGSWGWINLSDLRADWREVVSSLDVGQTSEPIDAGSAGVYILHVDDRREAGVAPLREVREEIEAVLVSQMARDSQERWLERLRRDAYVRYF